MMPGRKTGQTENGSELFMLTTAPSSTRILAMPRPLRPIDEGLVYHVINRGNNRAQVFFGAGGYAAFLDALRDLKQRRSFEL